jgi:hypothetical protein
MKHFSLEDWADFANELAPPDRAAAMRRHLDDGCKKCGRALQTWENLRTAARRLPDYDPPFGVVRSVKAAFGAQEPRKSKSRVAEMAELMFDSFRQPSLEGVRTLGVATRKMLYRHESLQIDLSVERMPGGNHLSIEGQILDSAKPSKPLSNIVVAAMRNREELAQALTNSFGEFHLECPAQQGVELFIKVDRGPEVLIPLNLENEADLRG